MSISFFVVIFLSTSVYMLPSILFNSQRRLILKVWMPCNIKNEPCFWSLNILQVFCQSHMSFIHVSCDALIFAFLNNINMRFNVIGLRFAQILSSKQSLPKENQFAEIQDFKIKKISNCVEDHVSTIK